MATASCTACGGGPCCHDCCLLGCHDQHSRKLHNSVGVAGLAGRLRRACVADLHLQRVIHALHICILPCVCTLYKSHAQCFTSDFYATDGVPYFHVLAIRTVLYCGCSISGSLLCTASASRCGVLCCCRWSVTLWEGGTGQALRRRVWLPCRSTCL